MPSEFRSMIFSATVPQYIQELAKKYMKNPILIDLVGEQANAIPEGITTKVVIVESDSQKMQIIESFVKKNRDKKLLMFAETKSQCKIFDNKNYARFAPLHGDLSQGQRTSIMKEYRNPKSQSILVATDVAARGLDIDDIDVVIQHSVRHVDSFVHRSGRTGRAGKDGMNIVFSDTAFLPYLRKIETSLKTNFEYVNSLEDEEDQEVIQK